MDALGGAGAVEEAQRASGVTGPIGFPKSLGCQGFVVIVMVVMPFLKLTIVVVVVLFASVTVEFSVASMV